ncbi:MAG TPA: FAD-dependent oxidoreductase [bacterium]
MAELLDAQTKQDLTALLEQLPRPVNIIFFTKEKDCPHCQEQQQVLSEITALSSKITLTVYDMAKDSITAAKYGIARTPATVIISTKDHGIRLYGVTAGYEFSSLVETIIMVSTDTSGLSPEIESIIRTIDQPVHLEVMVTLTCPYCPRAVHAAFQLAMVSDQISADAVDSGEFPEVAQRYDVSGVPKTIINEKFSFTGAIPVESVYLEILKNLKPDEYKKVRASIQEAQGHRHVRPADPKHTYDMIIVGGGPAALSAAVYAARKELDVLLVADELGGQIINTAVIENYLGLPGISGKELAEQFQFHAEQFPIAEKIGSPASKVSEIDGIFTVNTADEQSFTGHTVIYCAGKEYQKLGIPGENQFVGHGIAFCATCDAPLYKGKKVAVIGGGNSALTAARDLMMYASEVHLVHRRDSFKADPTLVDEIKALKKVIIHYETEVKEFLGDEKLKGMRISTAGGAKPEDIEVNGVFLEIGLSPNTAPVQDLVPLNANREIPVNRDNSTARAGFFGAGDATDVVEKQIVIAAAEGAKAALAAYKFLVGKKVLKNLSAADSWTQ